MFLVLLSTLIVAGFPQVDADPPLPTFPSFPVIPLYNMDPEVNENFNPTTFDFFGNLLDSAKLAPYLECDLRVLKRREVRKFSQGSEWVEFLDVTLKSDALISGNKLSSKFPISSKFGRKRASNPWSGVGEHVKIEAGDYYNHVLNFIHDGKGHLVYLSLSNDLKTVLCRSKE